MEPLPVSPLSQLTHRNKAVSDHAKVASRSHAQHSKAIIAESYASLPPMTGAAFANSGTPQG